VRTRRQWLVLATLALLVTGSLTACSPSPDQSGPPTPRQIRAMLTAHARAVQEHDRAAFLAGVDDQPPAAPLRQAQRSEYANLIRLPLTHWAYLLGPRAQAPGAQAAARRRFGPSAVIYRVTLSYALRGIDELPSSQQLSWTFVRVNGRVVIADDTALAAVGGPSWRGPWDFGPLVVVHGAHALVVGHPRNRALLRPLAAAVSAAVPVVASVWGAGWARQVFVIVPASATESSADLGAAGAEPAPVAAVAASDGIDPVSGKVLAPRLVVDPRRLAGLSTVGLQILLQHEVAHLADAAATSESTPTWLVEGFAEYVGNLGSGQSVPLAASELAARVRHGQLPRSLPAAADFGGAAAAAAYQGAWLACRLIAARIGTAGLVQLYRAVGRSEAAPAAAADAGLRRYLHEDTRAFVRQWRAYLRSELGAGR
jgi:hypothetical protein